MSTYVDSCSIWESLLKLHHDVKVFPAATPCAEINRRVLGRITASYSGYQAYPSDFSGGKLIFGHNLWTKCGPELQATFGQEGFEHEYRHSPSGTTAITTTIHRNEGLPWWSPKTYLKWVSGRPGGPKWTEEYRLAKDETEEQQIQRELWINQYGD